MLDSLESIFLDFPNESIWCLFERSICLDCVSSSLGFGGGADAFVA